MNATNDPIRIAEQLRQIAALPQPHFNEVGALHTYANLMGFYQEPSPGYFTDDEARLALCLAADVIEAGDFKPYREHLYELPSQGDGQ